MRRLKVPVFFLCLLAPSAQAATPVNGAALFDAREGDSFTLSGPNLYLFGSAPGAGSPLRCKAGKTCAFAAEVAWVVAHVREGIFWNINGSVNWSNPGAIGRNCYNGVCAAFTHASFRFISDKIIIPKVPRHTRVTVTMPVTVAGSVCGVNLDPETREPECVFQLYAKGTGSVSYDILVEPAGSEIYQATWTFTAQVEKLELDGD